MALITVNDVGVISGHIYMPLVGVWTADLVIDQTDLSGFDPSTAVTIDAGGMTLSGVVDPNRAGDFLDAVHVRVIGGEGGMWNTATARSYAQPGAYVRDVLGALANDSGESLSSTIDTSFTGMNLTAWTIMAVPVSRALVALLDIVAPTYSWRILTDGTLWMGAESWPTASGDYDLIEQDPKQGTFELGVESPWFTPGFTVDGVGQVSRVEHSIEHNRIRSRVWVNLQEDRGLRASIAKMVAQETAAFDYFALYRCKVVSQSSDLTTVDVQPISPNDSKLPGLGRVPVRAGSGIKVQFSSGAEVLVGWDGGSPLRPYACLGLSSDGVQAIRLGGTDPVITKKDLQAFMFALNAAVVVAQDGGASLKSTLMTGLQTAGWSSGTTDGHCGSLTVAAAR